MISNIQTMIQKVSLNEDLLIRQCTHIIWLHNTRGNNNYNYTREE